MIKTVTQLAKPTPSLSYNIAVFLSKLAVFSVENMNIRLKVPKVYYMVVYGKGRYKQC